MIEIAVLFLVGYLVITLEHPLHVDKAATALIIGGLSWVWLFLGPAPERTAGLLEHHLVDVASIVFFLLAAMTIVEVIEAYDGFHLVTNHLRFTNKRALLAAIGLVTFFLSAVLDNLATSLVMLAVVAKRVPGGEDRLLFSGTIVVAANAGGAFSPIGDITTTMLWVGGQLTFPAVMSSLFLPALVAFVVPLALVCLSVKGVFGPAAEAREASLPGRNLVFFAGTLLLAAVPVAKAVLHVPPFLALLTGLGLLWLITEILGKGKLRYVDERPSLPSALKKVDLPSILFFIGILLAVAALDDAGILAVVAASLTSWLVHPELIAGSLGVLSSVFDNVPLVAGAARMFPLSEVPTDAPFWHWLALTAGTGGSILVVGSAAGIAAMGYSKLRFGWYARRIGLPALAGYAAALGVLWLQSRF